MMNKQEAIEKLRNESWKYYDSIELVIETKTVIEVIKQLDEPEKPVVPPYIDTWIQGAKYNGFDLYEAMTDDEMPDKVATWIKCNSEVFANALFYGYEVEKEKLYTVEIPNPNKIGNEINVLMMNGFRQVVIVKKYGDNWKKENGFRLTESEIKKDFEWAWQFAEEVEE